MYSFLFLTNKCTYLEKSLREGEREGEKIVFGRSLKKGVSSPPSFALPVAVSPLAAMSSQDHSTLNINLAVVSSNSVQLQENEQSKAPPQTTEEDREFDAQVDKVYVTQTTTQSPNSDTADFSC